MNTGIVTYTIKIINFIVYKLGIRIEFINTNKIPITISKDQSETIESSLNKLIESNINEQLYFQELKNTYKNYPNVSLLKAAITDKSGNIEMYKVKKSEHNLPNWTKGIASLNKDHHKKTSIDKSHIESEIVESTTFKSLLQRFKIVHIDLLVIDTEGYDLKIIEIIEFDKLKQK